MEKDLALKIFEGFSIQRWNDLVRPFDLVEMDKAGEKMVLAYIIGKYEEHNGHKIDWYWMIYASLLTLQVFLKCFGFLESVGALFSF